MVTQATRFDLNPNGTIYDKLTCKSYTSLEEVLPVLVELNDHCYDFEEELGRQRQEINGLIGSIDEDCYP